MPSTSDEKLAASYNGSKVLIAGGLGMIGSNLARRLVGLGAHVTILDAMLSPYGGNYFNVSDVRERLEIRIGDIRNESLLSSVLPGVDYLFSLAAQVSYTDSNLDPLNDLDINCRGQLLILEALRKHNRNARVLFAGSRMQYGPVESTPVTENTGAHPLSIYALHKFAGEYYHRIYHNLHGLRTVTVRITNPYGPRSQMKHSKYSLINWFIRTAMESKEICIFGEGSQIRDYIFVDDIVDGMLAAAAVECLRGQAYNLGSGVGTRFVSMVETVLRVVGGGTSRFVPWPRDYEFIETGDFVADIALLKAETGWKPSVDLDEGVRRTFEYYKEHRANYW